MGDAQTAFLPFPKPAVPVLKASLLSLQLANRVQETQDTVSFHFNVLNGGCKHYPGQAVALNLPMDTGVATRTFTVSSDGLSADKLSVTVKAADTGYATKWMHQALDIGDRIDARGPFGHFTLAHHPNQPLLLIGGGSGFTPMMSMLRWLHGRGETTDVVVIQCARRVGDLLFRDELQKIAAEMPNLTLFDVATQPDVGEAWSGYRGRVTRSMIRAMVPDSSHRTTFCCGPEGFMEQVSRALKAEGLSAQNFHTETFGGAGTQPVATPTAVDKTVSDDTAQRIPVTFRGTRFDLQPDIPLSTALAAVGQRIPTGCGQGQCGTCRLKLVEGDVDMQQDGGLSPREVNQGFILACCSTAKGALVIEDSV